MGQYNVHRNPGANHHRALVAARLAADPNARVRPLRTIEDVAASHERQTALKRAHRASLGNAPTRDELRAIGGRNLEGTADVIADQIERQRRE